MVSAFTALLSMALFIVAIVLFVLGVVVKQGNMIQRELWTIQRASTCNWKRSARSPKKPNLAR
jgi:hypothetical protein